MNRLTISVSLDSIKVVLYGGCYQCVTRNLISIRVREKIETKFQIIMESTVSNFVVAVHKRVFLNRIKPNLISKLYMY